MEEVTVYGVCQSGTPVYKACTAGVLLYWRRRITCVLKSYKVWFILMRLKVFACACC